MPWELIIQSPNTERTEFEVKPGKTTLGRKSKNDIVVLDDAASRYHAMLELNSATNLLAITDSGSTNGTFVNGKQISKTTLLEHNDQVRIGLHLLTIISKDSNQAENQKTVHLERPTDYETLLVHSTDNYAFLLLDLSKELSRIQNLAEARKQISEFVGRMLNAEKCGVVLAEHFNELVDVHILFADAGQHSHIHEKLYVVPVGRVIVSGDEFLTRVEKLVQTLFLFNQRLQAVGIPYVVDVGFYVIINIRTLSKKGCGYAVQERSGFFLDRGALVF